MEIVEELKKKIWDKENQIIALNDEIDRLLDKKQLLHEQLAELNNQLNHI